MAVIYLIFLAFFSYVIIGLFRIYALKKDLLDHPNHRSSHVVATPRGGGIVFIILWFLAILWFYWQGQIQLNHVLVFVPGALLVSIIGYWDDHRDVAAKWRFLAQVLAAVMSLVFLGGFSKLQLGYFAVHLGWFGSFLAVIAIVWSINLYNFMDGTDGIAAVEGLFVFGGGGYFIWYAGGHGLALLIWSLAAIIGGFLLWNRPPAKIFMGDVGSSLLGFLVLLFGLAGQIWYNVPLLLWLIIYGIFEVDTTLTLLRRMIHGEVWYQAHRNHAYQRLQLKGWSHGKILSAVTVINSILLLLALWAFYYNNYLLIALFIAIALLVGIYFIVEKMQPMYKK